MKRSLLFLTAACLFFTPAMADDKKTGKAEAPKESILKAQAAQQKDTPITEWRDAKKKLVDPLPDRDKETVYILFSKFEFIQATRVVERDIGNAVKACGENNPDMKDSMDTRFAQWKSAVHPILETADKQLDKDIDKLTVVKPKEFKKVTKLQNEAYEYGEKQIVKKPVSSKEACEGLVKSMNRTENEMISLLQETLLPESVLRDREERQQKEAAEKSASKKKKD